MKKEETIMVTTEEKATLVIKKALLTGVIIGSISGGIIGYIIGTGNITLPKNNPCTPVACDHYTREVIGGRIIQEKIYCCGTHGHDCPTY